MNIIATDQGAWINGKRVWPRKRRSWIAVLRRWRRMHPGGFQWARRRPAVVQMMIDGDDGSAMFQSIGDEVR